MWQSPLLQSSAQQSNEPERDKAYKITKEDEQKEENANKLKYNPPPHFHTERMALVDEHLISCSKRYQNQREDRYRNAPR